MCFGSKAAPDSSAPAPRPASVSSGHKTQGYPMQKSHAYPAANVASNDYAPPAGPPGPPGLGSSSRPAATDDYAPPPGPPPGHSFSSHPAATDDYAPPPGPPPSSGLPPAYVSGDGVDDFAPPPGPPPGPPPAKTETPQHDWQTAVPDTALLPPPPALFTGFDRSPATNASEDDAERGEAWCHANPLAFPPMDLRDNTATRRAMAASETALQAPHIFLGELVHHRDTGAWAIASARNCPDVSLVGFPPVYAPSVHSPAVTGRAFTAYYEVAIASSCKSNVSLAMGFTAMPYPPFRMPGWHRGSTAVHGDDGHRYTNDRWGGRTLPGVAGDFAMKPGGTYGIGMRFAAGQDGSVAATVFVTADGRLVSEWDLHEETDADQDLPVTGLEGFHDLSVAVGVFENVKAEVRVKPEQWLYPVARDERLALAADGL